MKRNLLSTVGVVLATAAGAASAALPTEVSGALTDAAANAVLVWGALILITVGIIPFAMGQKGLKKSKSAM